MSPRRARGPLLAVEELADGVRLYVVGPEVIEAQVFVPLEGGFEATLRSGLSQARESGIRLPAVAFLLTDRVAALCLDLPPLAQAGRAQIEGLVRFELEPHLPESGPSGLACGWATPARSGDQGGPVLTCGLPDTERMRLVESFRAAGLDLLGLYPRLGSALALAPELPEEATLLEASGNQLALTRWEQGGVARLRTLNGLHSTTSARDAIALINEPLTLVGEIGADALEVFRHAFPNLTELAPSQPGSVLGAARHLRREPGGERIAGLSAAAQGAPLWKRPWIRVAAAAALLACLVGAADFALSLNRDARREALDRRRARLGSGAASAEERQALLARRLELLQLLEPARDKIARREGAALRTRQLQTLLGVLTQAPPGVALDRCQDSPQGVVLDGLADTSGDAERYLGLVEASLRARGYRLTKRHVTREERGVSFSATYALDPSLVVRGRVK